MREALRRKFAAMSTAQIVLLLESQRNRYTPEAIGCAVGELTSRGKERLELSPIRALATFPFACPNCDGTFTEATFFCSGHCEDEASFVRYFRQCFDNGRYNRPDIQDVFAKRLALLVGGGYSDRQRRLSKRIRRTVITRDRGLCRKCGSPGTEIDHIEGNSSDLANLQFLCSACHVEKTNQSFVPIPLESVDDEMLKRAPLLDRVFAAHPTRLCDDSAFWKFVSRSIRSGRYRVVSERRMRRSGIKCPVCLAALPRRPRADYLRTGERHMRRCIKRLAERTRGDICVTCGAEAVWKNSAMAACQACAAHGMLEQVAAAQG